VPRWLPAPAIHLVPGPKNASRGATIRDMSNALRTFSHALGGLLAEDRPAFKRIDASRARYDDGSWLRPRPSA
jgi:hypothetical protein